MTATTRLAEFAVKTSLDDCPPEATSLVRRAALDTLGVTLAGAREPAARIVRALVRAEGGLPLATVLGTSLATGPRGAALANGVAGHAHDFDDTSFLLMGHPSVPLLAATLALAEAETADGRTLVTAYIVGFEVSAAIGAALNPAHYARGWHATSSIGTLGCAAAAARVLGLDVAQTRHALGIAASLAAGVRENFGTMTKPYHAGHAAASGVTAARLARDGLTASETALDGAQGYVAAFGGAGALDGALDGLGRRWWLVESGIAVKPYPSCALTHAAIDALLDLRERHGFGPEHVAEIEIGVTRMTPSVLLHPDPVTPLERKFSMQYCAAVALAEGRVDLDAFADDRASRPAVRGLMGRVRMIVDPDLPESQAQHAWSRVAVRLTSGRVLRTEPRGAEGHPDRPLPADRLREKFLACAACAISPDDAEGVVEQLEHLEDVPDVRALTARLRGELD